MQLHEIQREHKNKRSVRVGRGGRRGKTSGRGHKGQKARAGHKLRPEVRDVIKRIPKLRGEGASGGLTSRQSKPQPVNLAALAATFKSGDTVSPQTLVEAGLAERRGGKLPHVKILGNGEIKKKVTVDGCDVSASARQQIESAGGTVSSA